MSKNVKQVADETANKIVKDLVKTERQDLLTREEAIKIINQHIDDAFAEVGIENRAALYKAFSLLFHPDKEFATLDKELYPYLVKQQLTSEPFVILNNINRKYLLKDTANQSNNESNAFLQFISQMEESLNRYNQPFRFLANTLYWAIKSFIVVSGLIGALAVILSHVALSIANGVMNLTLNWLTSNQYAKEVNDYIESNIEEHKKNFLISVRQNIITALLEQNKDDDADRIRRMDDAELFELLIQEEFLDQRETKAEMSDEELLNSIRINFIQNVKDSVSIEGFTKLKLISIALFHGITKPLDEIKGSKITSLLLDKSLQIIAAPFVLTAVALLELSRSTVTGITFAGIGIASVSLISTLALFNAPLYALDLGRHAARKFQERFFGNEKSTEEFDNAGPRSLLMLEWHNATSTSKSEIPPIHTGPLFASSNSRKEIQPENVLQAKEDISFTY